MQEGRPVRLGPPGPEPPRILSREEPHEQRSGPARSEATSARFDLAMECCVVNASTLRVGAETTLDEGGPHWQRSADAASFPTPLLHGPRTNFMSLSGLALPSGLPCRRRAVLGMRHEGFDPFSRRAIRAECHQRRVPSKVSVLHRWGTAIFRDGSMGDQGLHSLKGNVTPSTHEPTPSRRVGFVGGHSGTNRGTVREYSARQGPYFPCYGLTT